MKKIFWFFTILTLFSSCSSVTNKPSYNENIKHDDTLHGVVLENYINIKQPQYIYHTPVGFICISLTGDPVINLIDTLDAHIIYSRINSGKGPKELLSPIGQGYNPLNQQFTVTDIGKMQINNYHVSDTGLALLNEIVLGNKFATPICSRNISDTLIAVLTAMPDQSLMLINDKAKVIDQIPYQILDIEGLNYKRNYDPSRIDISRKHKIIVAADPYLPSIMAYSYVDNKLQLLWKKMVFEPDYIIKNNWRWITDKNRGGFETLTVTDNFIYATYYGINRAEYDKGLHKKMNEVTLLIFDLDGNLVRSLLLDHNLDNLAISPDDRVLYGILDRPDYLIVKFEL